MNQPLIVSTHLLICGNNIDENLISSSIGIAKFYFNKKGTKELPKIKDGAARKFDRRMSLDCWKTDLTSKQYKLDLETQLQPWIEKLSPARSCFPPECCASARCRPTPHCFGLAWFRWFRGFLGSLSSVGSLARRTPRSNTLPEGHYAIHGLTNPAIGKPPANVLMVVASLRCCCHQAKMGFGGHLKVLVNRTAVEGNLHNATSGIVADAVKIARANPLPIHKQIAPIA